MSNESVPVPGEIASDGGKTARVEPVDPKEVRRGPERDKDDSARPAEIGGRDGPEPTRYGDWEKGGRCIDF